MRALAGVIVVLLLLAGCGQTGDLYWPQEEEKVLVDDDEPDSG